MTARDSPLPADTADYAVPAPLAAWRRVLEDAIAADPSGKLGVAARLGVSRPYVSRVSTGHIPRAPAKFVARVMALLSQVECPHLGRMLGADACRAYAERSYERIGAPDVPHWRACQRCEVNPLRALAAAGVAADALPPLDGGEQQPGPHCGPHPGPHPGLPPGPRSGPSREGPRSGPSRGGPRSGPSRGHGGEGANSPEAQP